jgi:hypothetical protein
MPLEPTSTGGQHAVRQTLGIWLLSCACGPTIPPPAPDAQKAVPLEPGEAAQAGEPSTASGASVGVPPSVGPATSACDGHSGANLAVGGTVMVSEGAGGGPSEGPAAAFDDHTGTKWVEGKNPRPWLGYQFREGQAHAVTQYAIGPAPAGSAGTDPVSWKFEAASDAAGPWVTLDTRTQQRFVNRQAMVWYFFPNTTAYRAYRLAITETGGGRSVELAELQLFGPGTPTFSVDDAIIGTEPHHFHYGAQWEGHTLKDTDFKPPKYGSSSSWSRKKDESFTFAFNGSQILLYGITHPTHGIAGVSIDSGPEQQADLNGYGSGDVLLYTSPSLCPPAQHLLRVRVTGDRNPKAGDSFVSIDRVKIVP